MNSHLTFEYDNFSVGNSLVIHADCLEWLGRIPDNSIHAVVTDPPYGGKEYDEDQLEKRANGKGGIWRLPPVLDNSVRAPLPRFTALNQKERQILSNFFFEWAKLIHDKIVPGAHIFIATNSYVAILLYNALFSGGLEFRGQVIRLVRTLRGGDRPKNAEKEFPEVSSIPRGCYEPWGLFRKPLPTKMKVSDCLKEYKTGGLRRISEDQPFEDVINSEKTPKKERAVADHPSLKPQSFLRRIVYAALPVGEGTILDPFAGSGSTIAAAESMGSKSIGIEKYKLYFDMSKNSIPDLKKISSINNNNRLEKQKTLKDFFEAHADKSN